MRTKKAGTAVTVVILLLVAACFIAADQIGIRVTLQEDRFSVKALFFSETVTYADLESVSTAADIDYGSRTVGSDTISIKTGTFRNSQFGTYQCAVVTAQKEVVVVRKHDGSCLVFNVKDGAAVSRLAEQLQQAISGRNGG